MSRAPARTRARTGRAPTSKAGFDLPEKTRSEMARARAIDDALAARHPDARCELDYETPLELLIATILSAQATDVGVNKATPGLFAAFPDAAAYADSGPEAIEPHIRTIGLFRNKARAIAAACRTIVEDFGGDVPDTMEDLLTLRGVARKTANVVLGNAFERAEGVVVDTHVARIAHRFGLTGHTDARKIERDLMALLPRNRWTMFSHRLIFHGRRVCKARGWACADDPVCRKYCANARPDA